jgi:hypothetical protein
LSVLDSCILSWYSPKLAAVEAGAIASTRAALRTIALLMTGLTAAKTCAITATSASTTLRTVALLVTSQTTAKACTIATSRVVVVSVRVASVGAEVGGAPASSVARGVPSVVGSRGRGSGESIATWVEATDVGGEATSISSEARGVTTKAVGIGPLSLGLLLGFGLAMLLGVLVAVPVLEQS